MRRYRYMLALLVLFVLLLGSLTAAAQENGPNREEAAGFQVRGATPRDAGEIRFITGPNQGDALEIALNYIRQNRRALGLTGADIGDVVVTDRYASAHNGVTHIYLRQRYNGIEVFGGDINVNVAADGSIINLGNSFVSNLPAAVNAHAPGRAAQQAVADAARHLGLNLNRPVEVVSERGGPEREVVLSDGGIAVQDITAQLVYQPIAPDAVRLAWLLEIEELDGANWWAMTVDAETGEVLAQVNYVDHDNWDAPASLATSRTTLLGTTATASSLPAVQTDGASYNVFALPKESPSDGPRTLEIDPAEPVASPYGWHDTDGVPGAEYTVTRGNNVHGYTDVDANGVPDPGSDPDGGPGLEFDFPLDLTQNPDTYRPAAVTNLFYWNNIIHDVFYGYGFDEGSGNFQVNNYGNGGLGNDDVRAEAQDGSGTNNANFGTPPDGSRPRMQMFIWTPPLGIEVSVHPPSPIAGGYVASAAAFGPSLIDTGAITGDVALVDDGVGVPSDGCEPFVGFPAGHIALLDRGACTFVLKVANAQAAGAIAVIVANNVSGPPITMGGSDPSIAIPSVMISLDDGNLFKANLPLEVTIEDLGAGIPRRDSDLDNGVIIHEYAHGISNRLTGGPATTFCLGNREQMGEGWSDWLALVLTTDPADMAVTARGIGSYVRYQPADGPGIRPTPYTTDMSINPTTYGDIGGLAVPHGVGYAWSTMLWEVYWNLVEAYGYNPDVYGDWTTGGNNLAIQLVIDGMKLQVCRPGFVDGRDAILQADQVLTGGANQCHIWAGFAKRGLGYSADQGSNNNTTDGVEAFDLPLGCHFDGFFGSLDNPPAMNDVRAGSVVPVVFSLGGDYGMDIFADGFPASQEISCETGEPTGSLQETRTPGNSGLAYLAEEDRYTYPWQTVRGWAGTCRQFVVDFGDGIDYSVNVKLTP
ncbi:MAG: T9SS-dependent M36 family metallopeptidase [Anaerolineae bacterium]|nr:T9SS-dependent M36 family metallopeptidase [Anaerolineae bacterium]